MCPSSGRISCSSASRHAASEPGSAKALERRLRGGGGAAGGTRERVVSGGGGEVGTARGVGRKGGREEGGRKRGGSTGGGGVPTKIFFFIFVNSTGLTKNQKNRIKNFSLDKGKIFLKNGVRRKLIIK